MLTSARISVYGAFLATLITFPAMAQDGPNPDIQATINSQFDAFRAEDVGRAWTYASPTIKGIFGSPENFGSMVRQGYPMVWNPAQVRMLELREVAGGLWQRVMVTDQSGSTHILDYRMIETSEGWQIDSVQLLPSAGVGA